MRGCWIEATLCLAWPAFAAAARTVLALHYIVTTAQGGAWVPIGQFVATVTYAIGTWAGIAAVLSVLRLNPAATERAMSTSNVKLGLGLGIGVSLLFPEGVSFQTRFVDYVLISRELFLGVLPALCFAHFLYLARKCET